MNLKKILTLLLCFCAFTVNAQIAKQGLIGERDLRPDVERLEGLFSELAKKDPALTKLGTEGWRCIHIINMDYRGAMYKSTFLNGRVANLGIPLYQRFEKERKRHQYFIDSKSCILDSENRICGIWDAETVIMGEGLVGLRTIGSSYPDYQVLQNLVDTYFEGGYDFIFQFYNGDSRWRKYYFLGKNNSRKAMVFNSSTNKLYTMREFIDLFWDDFFESYMSHIKFWYNWVFDKDDPYWELLDYE